MGLDVPAEPGSLGQLKALNDAGQLERYCQAHSFAQDGRTACNLPPVWVKR